MQRYEEKIESNYSEPGFGEYDLLPLLSLAEENKSEFINILDQSEPQYDFDDLKNKVKEYIVTPRGMVGSLRMHWKGDLLIGR